MVRALAFLALLSLAGCQTAKGTFCDIAKPIRLSPDQIDQLTDKQAAEFLGHNIKGQKLCRWSA